MGRYSTLNEEVQRFKKMLGTKVIEEAQDAIQTKPPCGCEKPEDEDKDKEIITGEKKLDEIIRCKKKGDCKLVSHTGKPLGYGSREAMEKREKQVNYFKHLNKENLQESFDKINETLDSQLL
jgi:hypothetical protein